MPDYIPFHISTGSIADHKNKIEKIIADKQLFILCDDHTKEFCDYIFKMVQSLSRAKLFIIKSGEKYKNLNTVNELWSFLSANKARRNAVLINLGGGLISDLGGFAASTYKRGISYINIPTTLLGMIDASIGGKTGINLEYEKNQVGSFSKPHLVLCDTFFLTTLPTEQFIYGFAEVIKHGLIYDIEYWDYCTHNKISQLDLEKLISWSIKIKTEIVKKDPEEKGLRKILNFGHTVGHSLETLMLKKSKSIPHGEAVAAGMFIETSISNDVTHLLPKDMSKIHSYISNIFTKVDFSNNDIPALIEIMKNDKKNNSDQINFTLLKKIGEASYNNQVDLSSIKNALHYYISNS